MRKVAFILTFPNTPTWNGKSAINERYHAKSRHVSDKRREEIINKGTYFYRWDDGWTAMITCKPCSEARTELRNSSGFCGYDWMIDSIIQADSIMTSKELREYLQESKNEETG